MCGIVLLLLLVLVEPALSVAGRVLEHSALYAGGGAVRREGH